jgi:hypothetical protein
VVETVASSGVAVATIASSCVPYLVLLFDLVWAYKESSCSSVFKRKIIKKRKKEKQHPPVCVHYCFPFFYL